MKRNKFYLILPLLLLLALCMFVFGCTDNTDKDPVTDTDPPATGDDGEKDDEGSGDTTPGKYDDLSNISGTYTAKLVYQLVSYSSFISDLEVVIDGNDITIDDILIGEMNQTAIEKDIWPDIAGILGAEEPCDVSVETIMSITAGKSVSAADYRWADNIYILGTGDNLFMLFQSEGSSVDRIFELV